MLKPYATEIEQCLQQYYEWFNQTQHTYEMVNSDQLTHQSINLIVDKLIQKLPHNQNIDKWHQQWIQHQHYTLSVPYYKKQFQKLAYEINNETARALMKIVKPLNMRYSDIWHQIYVEVSNTTLTNNESCYVIDGLSRIYDHVVDHLEWSPVYNYDQIISRQTSKQILRHNPPEYRGVILNRGVDQLRLSISKMETPMPKYFYLRCRDGALQTIDTPTILTYLQHRQSKCNITDSLIK